MTDQRDFPSTTEENQDEVKRNKKKKGKWGTKHTWMEWAGDIRTEGKKEVKKRNRKKKTNRKTREVKRREGEGITTPAKFTVTLYLCSLSHLDFLSHLYLVSVLSELLSWNFLITLVQRIPVISLSCLTLICHLPVSLTSVCVCILYPLLLVLL